MTSVKRHAEAKKDTLGPQWTQWVSKAITKLVRTGFGFLHHSLNDANLLGRRRDLGAHSSWICGIDLRREEGVCISLLFLFNM